FAAAERCVRIYVVRSLGAFAVVVGSAREAPGALIDDYAGLNHLAPALAVAMALFMVSLGGVPPAAGCWGKFAIFDAAITRGGIGPWLAVIMVVNSVISLGYYLSVVRVMFLVPGEERPARVPRLVTGLALLAAVAVLAVFVYPDMFARFPPG